MDCRPGDKHYIYLRWLHDNYDLVDPFGTFNSSRASELPRRRAIAPATARNSATRARSAPPSSMRPSSTSPGTASALLWRATPWERETYGFQFPRVFGGNGLWNTVFRMSR